MILTMSSQRSQKVYKATGAAWYSREKRPQQPNGDKEEEQPVPGPTQDFAGFTEECGFLEEAKESHLVIFKNKQKSTSSASKSFCVHRAGGEERKGKSRNGKRVAVTWAALSSRETLSLEHANKDRDSVKKWPIKAKNQHRSLLGENLPDTG